MTTAHRPQVTASRGTGSATISFGSYFTGGRGTLARHGKDLPSHTALKYRHSGASSRSNGALDEAEGAALRRQLEEKERAHFEALRKERARKGGATHAQAQLLGDTMQDSSSASVARSTSASSMSGGVSGGRSAAKATVVEDPILAAFDDADDDVLDKLAAADSSSESDEGESEEDEDDTEELMRELERIKREREEERNRKEREAAELAERDTTEAILKGNPLLTKGAASTLGSSGHGGSAAVRRRFGDDTVFSHTHANEPELRKRFINDMIRSDFHRQFLRKFVT